MIEERLRHFTNKKRATLLGVGPMSKNCIDATIDIANRYKIPIFLIASRRQIESEELGRGYVCGWSTEEFSKYVRKKDKHGQIVLSRDHGGPWQNPNEVAENMSLRDAMESAKRSFQVDIESGFDLIHIDPSIDIHSEPCLDEIVLRVFELYEFCSEVAKKCGKKILFEIGTEEQSDSNSSLDNFEYSVNKVISYCISNGLKPPTFVVGQTGSKVAEMKNIGTFGTALRVENEIPAEIQIPRVIEICKRNNIWLKEHNTDYLPDEVLAWHPKLSIHAANVAPEFGVAETIKFVSILKEKSFQTELDDFYKLSYNSLKWQKWVLPNTSCSMEDKATLCGHYVFNRPEFKDIKARVNSKLGSGLDLDKELRLAVERAIMRYVVNFKLLD